MLTGRMVPPGTIIKVQDVKLYMHDGIDTAVEDLSGGYPVVLLECVLYDDPDDLGKEIKTLEERPDEFNAGRYTHAGGGAGGRARALRREALRELKKLREEAMRETSGLRMYDLPPDGGEQGRGEIAGTRRRQSRGSDASDPLGAARRSGPSEADRRRHTADAIVPRPASRAQNQRGQTAPCSGAAAGKAARRIPSGSPRGDCQRRPPPRQQTRRGTLGAGGCCARRRRRGLRLRMKRNMQMMSTFLQV
mmetsp:Transcript_24160/g.57556  ORF Transcript_24160/g.57556 Transcript_24160/m.57556 type:complete len:249 (-) Transcript_24160:1245-1991(-)